MSVLPAGVLFDGDLNSIAELSLEDLDTCVLALFVLTASAIVWRSLWTMVSIRGQNQRLCREYGDR